MFEKYLDKQQLYLLMVVLWELFPAPSSKAESANHLV